MATAVVVRVVSLWLLCLLLVAVSAAALTAAIRPQVDGSSLDTSCRQTITVAVDKDCADNFVHAVFSGNYDAVSAACCGELACVREASCAVVLHTVCGNKWVDRCDSPASPPAAAAPAPTHHPDHA